MLDVVSIYGVIVAGFVVDSIPDVILLYNCIFVVFTVVIFSQEKMLFLYQKFGKSLNSLIMLLSFSLW